MADREGRGAGRGRAKEAGGVIPSRGPPEARTEAGEVVSGRKGGRKPQPLPEVGATFGRYTVIGEAEPYVEHLPKRPGWTRQHPRLTVRCECGNETVEHVAKIRSGTVVECPPCRRLDPVERALRAQASRARSHARRRENLDEYRAKRRKEYRATDGARRKRASRYGLTLEELDALVARGRCDACGDDTAVNAAGRSNFHIDHDHVTGKVRGLLCNRCNLVLGKIESDPDRIVKLCEYARLNLGLCDASQG